MLLHILCPNPSFCLFYKTATIISNKRCETKTLWKTKNNHTRWQIDTVVPEDFFGGFLLLCVVTSFSSVLHLLHIQAQVFVPMTGLFLEHFKITLFGSRRLVRGGTASERGSAVWQFMSGQSQSPLKSSGHFSAHPLSRRAKELDHCADPTKLCS